MQIVISMTEAEYDCAVNYDGMEDLYKNLKNGVMLPEGHGRLIDADALLQDIEELQKSEWYNDQTQPMSKLISLHEGVEVVRDIYIKQAPTIIEADMRGE